MKLDKAGRMLRQYEKNKANLCSFKWWRYIRLYTQVNSKLTFGCPNLLKFAPAAACPISNLFFRTLLGLLEYSNIIIY